MAQRAAADAVFMRADAAALAPLLEACAALGAPLSPCDGLAEALDAAPGARPRLLVLSAEAAAQLDVAAAAVPPARWPQVAVLRPWACGGDPPAPAGAAVEYVCETTPGLAQGLLRLAALRHALQAAERRAQAAEAALATAYSSRSAELARSEARYHELAEAANSIVLRWDSQGRVTFLNRFGLEFFGFAGGDIVGRSVVAPS